MIDILPELLAEFGKGNITPIPIEQDDDKTNIPCITYQEKDNRDIVTADNAGYSEITILFEVWDRDYINLTAQSKKIDKIMKKFMFDRISAIEQNFEGLRRKILMYRVTLKENY